MAKGRMYGLEVDIGLVLWIRSGTPLTLDVSKANSTARLGAQRLGKSSTKDRRSGMAY